MGDVPGTRRARPVRTVLRIDDAADRRIADYVSLTDVDLRRAREPAAGLFMAESLKVIQRAISAGCQVRSLLCQPKWLAQVDQLPLGDDVPVYVADAQVLQAITGYRVHRGLLAAMDRPREATVAEVLADARRVIILDGLVDHTNVGAAFRSSAALGIDSILLTQTCADPLYRRAVRVSMGTVFQVPWARLPAPDYPRLLAGWRLLALTPDPAAAALDGLTLDHDERVALVVGSEGPGLATGVLAAVPGVRIPMANGVDSLNVAAAVAVAAYAIRRH